MKITELRVEEAQSAAAGPYIKAAYPSSVSHFHAVPAICSSQLEPTKQHNNLKTATTMILPKRTLTNLPRATRCLSTTAIRPMATPTSRITPNDPRGNPVDDIDLVFDYPSQGQTSHQREPLETSGLDYHMAMPHRAKAAAGMAQGMAGAGKMAKEMGADAAETNSMYARTRPMSH
jgi:hypothetical protein